jgi:hypothetical protein
MKRIWAHEIPFFVSRPRETAHPGLGPAQPLLTICLIGLLLLRLSIIFGTLCCSLLYYFDSSRVGPELVHIHIFDDGYKL